MCHAERNATATNASWGNGDVSTPQDLTSDAPLEVDGVATRLTDPPSAATGAVKPDAPAANETQDSCLYCHVDTALGGKQVYAGKRQYIVSTPGVPGSEWDNGFGHNRECTLCHAAHVTPNAIGTFQGPAKPKVLRVLPNASGADGAPEGYAWQDELIVIGSVGKASLLDSTIPGMAEWAARQTVDDLVVDALNVPLFPNAADAIAGTNVRPGASVFDAQVSAFCTFCHASYGYASEETLNPDGANLLSGDSYRSHPLKAVDGGFEAAGKSASVPSQVAFADASTCRSCHDAGARHATGLIIQSFPHFTPGYYRFLKSGARAGASMTNAPPIPESLDADDAGRISVAQAWIEDASNFDAAQTVADGQCLKCHVSGSGLEGVGHTY